MGADYCLFLFYLLIFSFHLEHFIRSVFLPGTVYWVEHFLMMSREAVFLACVTGRPWMILQLLHRSSTPALKVNAGLVGLITSQVHQLGDCIDSQFQLQSLSTIKSNFH